MDQNSELIDFHRFLGDKLTQGDTLLSPEELLDEWRMRHADEDDAQDDEEAIREAVALYQAGDRGVPFEEFDREFRKRHGLPPRQ